VRLAGRDRDAGALRQGRERRLTTNAVAARLRRPTTRVMSVALLPPDTGPTTAELLAALPHLGMHAMDGLMMEGVLFQAVADALGTPAWVVSAGHVRGQIAALRRALDEAGLVRASIMR